MRCWRFVHERYAAEVFTGEGTRRHGSRWVGQGRSAVYVSDSAAQAVLETLVRIEDTAALRRYKLYHVEIPDDAIETAKAPDGWRGFPPPLRLQDIGDRWLEQGQTLALAVPSVIVPGKNLILNPAHEAFTHLRPKRSDWVVDARLTK